MKKPFSILRGDETALWPEDFGIAPHHCIDVLLGGYDIPFDPATPPIVIDIGANVGAFAKWAVHRWPSCSVHCYEPQPKNFERLQRTVATLAPFGRVTCNQVAVSDTNGTTALVQAGVNCGEWSINIPRYDPDDTETYMVKTILATALPKGDILKIDAEGAEMQIISCLGQNIGDFSAVMIEFHNDWLVPHVKEMMARGGFALVGERSPAANRHELKWVKSWLVPNTPIESASAFAPRPTAPAPAPSTPTSPSPAPMPTSPSPAPMPTPESPVRRILIGTPIRDWGLDTNFMRCIMPILLNQQPGRYVELRLIEGPSVNFARNELAIEAIKGGFDDIVFIDADMLWTEAAFERILSHPTKDVVVGIYCRKKAGPPKWLLNVVPGAQTDADGLVEVLDAPTGWMKIKTSVFHAIAAKFPEREYILTPEKAAEGGKTYSSFEWFPMGITGPRTPEVRLAKIKELLAEIPVAENLKAFVRASLIEDIRNVATAWQPPGSLRGEDYYFCHLVRACGMKIYADFGSPIIGHIGKVQYPITPEMVGVDPTKPLNFSNAGQPPAP